MAVTVRRTRAARLPSARPARPGTRPIRRLVLPLHTPSLSSPHSCMQSRSSRTWNSQGRLKDHVRRHTLPADTRCGYHRLVYATQRWAPTDWSAGLLEQRHDRRARVLLATGAIPRRAELADQPRASLVQPLPRVGGMTLGPLKAAGLIRHEGKARSGPDRDQRPLAATVRGSTM